MNEGLNEWWIKLDGYQQIIKLDGYQIVRLWRYLLNNHQFIRTIHFLVLSQIN